MIEQDGVVYERGADTPFTGKVVDTFVDGQLQSQVYYKDGLRDGSETTWYNNGQIRTKCNYKNGEKDGMWIKFARDGRLQLQKIYQEGKRVH
jgi:antitoxin component YwqK of YwqJK toxin-antitoxin module